MDPKDQPKRSTDSWELLAKELLGEEPEPAEPPAAREEVDAEVVPDQEVETVPPPDVAETLLGSEGHDEEDREPAQEEEGAMDTSDVESATERFAETLPLQHAEPPEVEAPEHETPEAETPEAETPEPEAPEESGEPSRTRPRRTRRGRRRRSRRSTDEAAETSAEPLESELPEGDVEEEFDTELAAIDDGDEPTSEGGDAKSNAIPTWAEAISYLSAGPEDGTSRRNGGGSRPRRRRRRGGKPPQG